MAACVPTPQDGIDPCFLVPTKAQLVVRVSVNGEPTVYKCSLCDQIFPLSEHGTPKEGMADLWKAFRDHVRISHHQDLASSEPR